MTCNNCNNGVLEPVDIDEAKESGAFKEEWKCVNCAARLYIEGLEQDPPNEWTEWGRAA